MKLALGLVLCGLLLNSMPGLAQEVKAVEKEIILPAPRLKGAVSVEQAINERRSRRMYLPQELTLGEIGQLLWSAQGITGKAGGLRAAPSAGASYPIEIYLLKKDGLFHYLPEGHKLKPVLAQDLRRDLAEAALGQAFVAQASADIVLAAVYRKVTSRYGQRGIRYTDMEAGHIAENIHLQAVALGLGSVPVGAFDDQAVKKLLKLPDEQEPLYIIPVGYTK